MKQEYTIKYECPSLKYCNLEMEGFLCESEVYTEVDESKSFWGDSSNNYDGDIIF